MYASPKLIKDTNGVFGCKDGAAVNVPCSYNPLGSYVRIDLTPTTFSNAAITYTITAVKFSSASNHEDSTYELFFRLTKDTLNTASTFTDFMLPLTVI